MSTKPFADVVESNATWCVDFKGQFRTQHGRWCYPLTILDVHTRFLLRCEALLEPTSQKKKETRGSNEKIQSAREVSGISSV